MRAPARGKEEISATLISRFSISERCISTPWTPAAPTPWIPAALRALPRPPRFGIPRAVKQWISARLRYTVGGMNGTTGTARIERIVYGGVGLAHFEGRACFIPFTAPGDTVEFTVTRRSKGVLFAEPARILEPSPLRREPACPVFGRCGGCHFLHLDYADEIDIKRETVLDALRRIAGIATELAGFTPCPERFGYRNHALFKTGAGGEPGFSKRESTELVPFPASGCLLLPEPMRQAIADLPRDSLAARAKVRTRLDSFGAVHFWGLQGAASPPDILMEAGGLHFPVQPEAFFQVNRHLNTDLMKLVAGLPSGPVRRALDVYCGAGFFTLPLARMAEEAIGIEIQRQACRSALAAAKMNRIPNVRIIRDSASRAIARIKKADLVLTDPPRSGMPPEVLRGILGLRPRQIIMVSCDPPTFARDAARLVAASYAPSQIHAVDLFPGTFHVETIGLFTR